MLIYNLTQPPVGADLSRISPIYRLALAFTIIPPILLKAIIAPTPNTHQPYYPFTCHPEHTHVILSEAKDLTRWATLPRCT